MNRLYRSRDERMVAGVAGGIAEYFNIDPTLVRLGFVLFTVLGSGTGLLAYVILAVLMPLEPERGAQEGQARQGAVPMHHATPSEQTRREIQEEQIPEFRR